MTIIKTPPPEAKKLLREATAALAAKGLIRPFRCELVRENGVEMTKVRSTQPIPLSISKLLPGRWYMHVEWLLRRVPGESDLLVWRSSVGLNVEGTRLTRSGERACLVRYDVDNERPGPGLAPLGRYLNVLQPEPLADHVHYPTFDGGHDPWPVELILELFESPTFVDDLEKRLEAP